MPKQVKKNKEQRIEETRERAVVLLEDIQWMRNLVATPAMSRVDARSLSSKLRRIVNDGDLRQVANPRIGNLAINAPKTIEAAKYKGIQFFYAGFKLDDRPRSIALYNPNLVTNIPKLSNEMHLLYPDEFLRQPICCFKDKWLTRRDMLLFVAHNAMGVHFDSRKDEISRIVSKIRNMFVIRTERKEGMFMFNVEEPVEDFVYAPNTLDIASYECLAIAHYLTNSASVIELEKIISVNG